MRNKVVFEAGLLLVLCALPAAGGRQSRLGSLSPSVREHANSPLRATASFAEIPLQFIPNRGRTDERVAFYVLGRDKTVFFARDGLTFELAGQATAKAGKRPRPKGEAGTEIPRSWAVKLDYVGSNEDARPVGLEESGAVFSFFKGKPEAWESRVPAFSKIVYRELWPGIDLVYSGTSARMKYEFVVRPGGEPERIKLRYRGASGVRLEGDGRLEVETPAGPFQDERPTAYQEINGTKVEIPVSYSPVKDSSAANDGDMVDPAFTYGFEVEGFDRSRTLVIDPAVLVYCGFVGGPGSETAYDIAVDAAGNAYIAGETSSDLSFPTTVGPDLAYNGGDSDAFVAKVDASGEALVYCSYIGGSGRDVAKACGVDQDGFAYIAGFTDSTESTFPVLVGPDLSYNGGSSDAFVAKVDASGTALVYCGYIGGAGMDRAEGLAVHPEGVPYIVGTTDSPETTFPVTWGPDLTYNGGDSDAFVAVLFWEGDELFYCGYIGGAAKDEGLGITCYNLTPWGEYPFVDVVGTTSSDESTFPVIWGPDLTYNGGDSDGFIARIEPAGSGLWLCGYIGGAGSDVASKIACFLEYSDVEGRFYTLITGTTSSPESSFPVTGGPDLTYNGGDSDAFVAQLNSTQTGWDFCGYIGGSGTDVATDITAQGHPGVGGEMGWTRLTGALIAGYTSSTESTFPVTIGPDLTYNGGASDAFVARLNLDRFGAGPTFSITWCGYIGGSDRDEGLAIEVYIDNPMANVPIPGTQRYYLAGNTSSAESTFPVSVGPGLSYNGGATDAFVVRGEVRRPTITSLSPSSAKIGASETTLVVTGSDFLEGALWRIWRAPMTSAVPLATTFISSSEVQAIIPSDWLVNGGHISIDVLNPDMGVSNPFNFEVLYPVPSLTALSPSKAPGGFGFNLSLVGSEFYPGACILWNGSSLGATYVSGTELEAAIPAEQLTSAGEYEITVSNPAPTPGPSNAMVFIVSGFALASSQSSVTVTAGQYASYTIQVSPQFGSFDSPVSLACSGLPAKCTGSFSQATVTPGASSVSTTLTLQTTAPSRSAAGASGSIGPPPPPRGMLPIAALFALTLMLFRAFLRGHHRKWLAAGILACLVVLGSKCSVDGTQESREKGTPPGSYTITVTGTSGGLTVSSELTLIVK